VCLITTFSNVLEKIIYDRLIKHFQINSIQLEEQFGCRTSSSTEKAAFKLIDEILNALNHKMMEVDLQEAFDCVNHDIFFLSKLEIYGITETAYKLIKS